MYAYTGRETPMGGCCLLEVATSTLVASILPTFFSNADSEAKMNALRKTLSSPAARLQVLVHGYITHEIASNIGHDTHKSEAETNVSCTPNCDATRCRVHEVGSSNYM